MHSPFASSTAKALDALPPFPSFPLNQIRSFPDHVQHLVKAAPPLTLDTLKELPRHLPSLAVLKNYYIKTDPFHSALVFCVYNILWTWIGGEITGNVSQVDRVWQLLPLAYTTHFTLHPLFALYHSTSSSKRPQTLADAFSFVASNIDHRQALMLLTQTIWSFRLSWNAWRRGFFDPRSEDYRWPIWRAKLPAPLFKLFNLGFIAIFQNLLLLAIAVPSYYLLVQAHPTTYNVPKLPSKFANELKTSPYLTKTDYALAAAAILCVYGEYLSDNIQQAYQSWKHTPTARRSPTKTWSPLFFPSITWGISDLTRGFVSQGVWGYSRHPAFLLEQTFWWLQSLFPLLPILSGLPDTLLKAWRANGKNGVETARQLYEQVFKISFPWWAFVGSLGLSGLFVASTIFTESITTPKYPAYKTYQKRVGMFLPGPFLGGTYFKRIWISVTQGNEARRRMEKELGWGERIDGRLKVE